MEQIRLFQLLQLRLVAEVVEDTPQAAQIVGQVVVLVVVVTVVVVALVLQVPQIQAEAVAALRVAVDQVL
jgi:hypothetical protein